MAGDASGQESRDCSPGGWTLRSTGKSTDLEEMKINEGHLSLNDPGKE